jgi:flagellar hook-associated protein 2
MGISSLGVGSSILTQDVIDQLRKADDAKFITPVTLELANTKDKSDAFNIVDANMTNLIDSIDAIKDQTVFDARTASVTGTSVEVTASENSDMQDFTLDVTQLATKQVEQSGAFTDSTDLVASGAGTLSLSVGGGTAIDIAYDATTTLEDLKKLINTNAGDQVNATIVKISDTESRLMLNSVGTGASQDITMTDSTGGSLDTALTTDFDLIAF